MPQILVHHDMVDDEGDDLHLPTAGRKRQRIDLVGKRLTMHLLQQVRRVGSEMGCCLPLASLPSIQREGKGQRGRGGAAEANVGSDLIASEQGYVLDKEGDHALAFLLGCPRVVPDGGEVLDEGKDKLAIDSLADGRIDRCGRNDLTGMAGGQGIPAQTPVGIAILIAAIARGGALILARRG